MVVKNKVKSKKTIDTDKVISDTTMMFKACACYALHTRHKFGKQRLVQFIADIEQMNRESEYADIAKYLKEKLDIDFPDIDEK